MSNRFKYRVWHKEEKRYVTGNFSISPSGHLHKICGDEDGVYEIEMDTQVFAVEQCTGKEDKNKRLMYGGDLVRCANGTVAPIIWDQDRCAFLIDTKPYKTEISGLEEIVGNIHEVKK